ncbi:MAG: metal ABC transporter substrate-binding protein [bacterium]|nr:metal ABC transporter substrate-binding protein [bacterium]
MKNEKLKKLSLLVVIMIVISVASYGVTAMLNNDKGSEKDDTITIATSFYPIYIAALNVTAGMDNVKVINLMENQQGCLHDYQLTTENMRTLEGADALIINGAGMEAFLDDIKTNYKSLDIIDSSEDISLLTITGEVHDHDHEEDADHNEDADHDHEEEHNHNHGDYNAHIWLDPERYEQQIENIAEGLAKLDPEHSDTYKSNAKGYIEKVAVLETEMKAELKDFDYNDVIIFHNSMEYLCQPLGIHVAYSLNVDGDASLSAGEVATVIEEVKENNIKVLFSEKQYESSIADRIASETGAKVYVFDSLVTGNSDKDAYLDGMRKNMELLKTALYK